MSRLIDADALNERMYHDAFETDSDMQRWDGGCWIRYKMFENAIKDAPTVEPRKGKWMPFKYGDDTWHQCSCCGVADKYIEKIPRPDGSVADLQAIRNFCPNCGASMVRGDTDG